MDDEVTRALETPTPGEGVAPGPPTHRRIWVDLLLYPTHTLPTAAAPVLIGLGLAAREGVLAPVPALVAFLGSWFIHLAGVFTDNHELLRRHPEVEEHPELTRALRDGTLRLSALRAAIALCLLLAVATAPWLYAIGGAPVLVLGAIGVAASLSYHGVPIAYVRTGLADPVFLVLFGQVAVVGTLYIQVAATCGAGDPWTVLAALPRAVWWAGLPCGALVTAVMLVDDLRDRAFDAMKGWRTGTVRFGPAFVRLEYSVLVASASAAPVAFWLATGHAPALLPLLTLPMTAGAIRGVWRGETPAQLYPLSPRTARLALAHSALLAIGLALAR